MHCTIQKMTTTWLLKNSESHLITNSSIHTGYRADFWDILKVVISVLNVPKWLSNLTFEKFSKSQKFSEVVISLLNVQYRLATELWFLRHSKALTIPECKRGNDNTEVLTIQRWRRLIGSPKLQIIFHKRATKYRSLLRKMTYKDKGITSEIRLIGSPKLQIIWSIRLKRISKHSKTIIGFIRIFGLRVCACVPAYVHMYVCLNTHTYTHIHTNTNTHM